MANRKANRDELVEIRHAFAVKHGFIYKSPQYHKNCIVIRWKINGSFKKANEYFDVCNKVFVNYKLINASGKEDWLIETSLRLVMANIYDSVFWDYHHWSIPNEFKEVQEYVMTLLPKWAKMTRKK